MKPQLLIIPGWEGSRTSWKNFIDLAHNDFEVYCYDLPCFGAEPCPNDVWGVEEYAGFIREKIKIAGLVRPTLLGHSFGGQIAAYLAVNFPLEFSKLILSGAAIFRQTPTVKKIVFGAIAKIGKLIFSLSILKNSSLTAFMKKGLYRLANSDYNETSGQKREIYKKITNQNIGPMINKINIPTLVIWGENDSYVSLANGEKIAKLIPGARLEIIKRAGHGLHLKHLTKFYNLIKEFAGSSN
jgi:pimeloyl-ACP methyl ester carboxylesterase